jgi:transposase
MKLEDEWFRPAACYLVNVMKKKQKDVAELFGVNPKRVSRAIARYEETGEHKNRAGQGRKRTARDEDHIEQVKELLELNNHTKRRNDESGNSTRKIAKKLDISQFAAHKILKDDLGLTAWKKIKGQKLTDRQKKNRLDRAKALKTRFVDGKHRQILFTDEKFFPIEEAFNHQNDRIWAAERPDEEERVVQRQMKPKGVMVWCGVGYNAKAPLIFVKSGLKIDTDLYRREILKPVKRWAIDHYGTDEEGYWKHWTFQQDSAPSHASFKENLEKFKIPT